MSLSKEEKNAQKNKFREENHVDFILNEEQVEKMFEYIDEMLEVRSCDDSLRHTKKWLNENIEEQNIEDIIREINDMGGYCDCEVIYNWYEEYDF